MAKVVTMGEIMLRLSPPGYQRFAQASEFEINYGGAEANVAVSLAQLGHDVTYISKIPSNAIGEAAIATLKKSGVDCRYCTGREKAWNLLSGKRGLGASFERCL